MTSDSEADFIPALPSATSGVRQGGVMGFLTGNFALPLVFLCNFVIHCIVFFVFIHHSKDG
jgi:hypothetical protein